MPRYLATVQFEVEAPDEKTAENFVFCWGWLNPDYAYDSLNPDAAPLFPGEARVDTTTIYVTESVDEVEDEDMAEYWNNVYPPNYFG
jgi:hypothetical protein